jgi:hypothetical protein
MEMADRYFSYYVDHYKQMAEVRRDHEKLGPSPTKKAARLSWPPLFPRAGVWLTLLRPRG